MPTLPLTLPSIPFTGTGGAVSAQVPGLFDVAVGGRGYMVDWEKDSYRFESSPLLRGQTDTSDSLGSQSINPEGLWRHGQDDWHHGTGQSFLDRGESNFNRFRSSKGCDIWSKNKIGLLNDTSESLNSASTNLNIQVAGSRLYVADGQTPKYTADPFTGTPTYTSVTGIAAADITAMASNGYYVLIAQGASGIYITDTSVSTASSWITGTVTDVAVVKGRVMASAGASIYEIATAFTGGPAALPSALMTHGNGQFSWVGFAEGLNHIYAAGYSGDKSEIYRITIQADGTALTAPAMAASLPDGEIISSIYGYLGFILVGTTRGFRLAVADSNGNLTLGALIETDSTVRAFEGQGRFVWFSWEIYDSVSSGLGRIDLSLLTDDAALTPAYASDLMATSQANINSIATFSDKRVFSVSGDGLYVEDSSALVSEGILDSGWVTYGLSEKKTAVSLSSMLHFHTAGTVTAYLKSAAGNTFDALGSTTSNTTTVFDCKETDGFRHEVRWKLERDATDNAQGPHVHAWTLKALPRVAATQFITCPLLIRERVEAVNGSTQEVDVVLERDHIESLWLNRTITSFQEGNRSHTGIIEDLAYEAEAPSYDGTETQGVLTVRFKIIQ